MTAAILNFKNGANEMLFYPGPLSHFVFIFSAILAIIWKLHSDQSRNNSSIFFVAIVAIATIAAIEVIIYMETILKRPTKKTVTIIS